MSTSIAQEHAEWVRLLRPDGPFISVPVLTEVFTQGLDAIPDSIISRVRQAWGEVQSAPDVLSPAWCELVLRELLGYGDLAIGNGLEAPDVSGGLCPDAVLSGPDGNGGRAERLIFCRRPWGERLMRASRYQPSAVTQVAELCRQRGIPLGLLTNGALWALVHTTPGTATTTAVFDADLWLEERALLRAFASLLGARRVLPPAPAEERQATSLAALFIRSANAQTEVTNTLGRQVQQAVELLVGEMARLDRECGGELLSWVRPRDVYQGALTVLLRLVFLLYAEEQRLLPVDSGLYAEAYSVAGLYDQLETDRAWYGEGFGDRRAAAWPRLLATFRAVHEGCEHDELRMLPYGGELFDSGRFSWLQSLHITDRVVHAILDALLVLKRRGSVAERLSYKGLGVEQIGHVYEGLLEFSCLRVDQPYVGLIGKREPELPLAELEHAFAAESDVTSWLTKASGATSGQITKAIAVEPGLEDQARLHAACDNDDELAGRTHRLWGLLRKDLRSLPAVFPTGSLLLTQVSDRRATGTHYTPRELAEEIVEHALAPLCHSPGPAEGAEKDVWQVKPAAQLLELNVLDPAMGSGAFLVAACRYIAVRVVEAWERDGLPDDVIDAVGPDFTRDDLLLEAKRRVATRCLSGVDRDERAVGLAKLSLWLETLAKDKPFCFLDHALRCGDSLVGLISEAQVRRFHFEPERGRYINARLCGTIDEIIRPMLIRVQELREQIRAEPVRDAQRGAELSHKLRTVEALTHRLRFLSDAVCAAALSTAGVARHGTRGDDNRDAPDTFDDRLTSLADGVEKALEVDGDGRPTFRARQAEKEIRELINPMLCGPRAEPIRPLHWPLEFPDVTHRGGFDAIVSNPPFSGGSRISGALGSDFREYLKQHVANNRPGNADLCVYFLIRYSTLALDGRIGIITTNTIAQGDSREVGLDQLIEIGRTANIYRAEKSRPWPGAASLEVSLVWVGNSRTTEVCILNGRAVPAITAFLESEGRIAGRVYRLAAPSHVASNGSKIYGEGFLLDAWEVEELLRKNFRNSEVIRSYIGGDDLNSRPDSSGSRWVIDFQNWDRGKAQSYPEIFSIIERRVKPYRLKLGDGNPAARKWWQYERRRSDLYQAISSFPRVVAIARLSKVGLPLFVPVDGIFSDQVVVFATDSAADLALLSSAIHFTWWTIKGQSTLETRLRYTASDGFETFAQPRQHERMNRAGEELDVVRRKIMRGRRLGLTKLYNLVYDKIVQEEDVTRLREIHVEIDEAVREAYALDEEREPEIREFEAKIASAPLPAWREIDLGHGFHETRQGVRFTISPQAQTDVLDKLLALNHYRYQQEQEQGVTRRKRRRAGTKPEHSSEGALFEATTRRF